MVDLRLHCSDKDITPPDIFKNRFYELCHSYSNYYRIYTDGSKSDDRVGAAVVHRSKIRCVRLPNTASIFRAELYALLLAIEVVTSYQANRLWPPTKIISLVGMK